MTAYLNSDETVLVSTTLTPLPVTSSQVVTPLSAGILLAGVSETNVIRFPRVSDQGEISVRAVPNVLEVSDGFVNIALSWTQLTAIVLKKKLALQSNQEPTRYFVFAIDACVLYYTYLYTSDIPSNVNVVQNDIDLTDFVNVWQNHVNYPIDQIERVRIKTIESSLRVEGVTSSHFLMAIDLSNPSGSYRHPKKDDVTSGVSLCGIHAAITKDTATDKWACRLGVVLDTSSSGSIVSWMKMGSLVIHDTGTFQSSTETTLFPQVTDLTVVSGSLTRIASNHATFIPELTSGTPLNDAAGKTVFPEPGDILVNPVKSSGNGSIFLHYHLWYVVE